MDILLQILEVLTLGIAGFLGVQVALYFMKNKNLTILNEKSELVKIGVRFVEQAFFEMKGAEKFDKAVEWITNEANQKGLKFTENELKAHIENAVRTFKDEFSKTWNSK